jgi:CBS domain-containing protein
MFVRDWMSTPAVAMSSSASVLDALPVLDGDELRGIVTREDLHALLGYGEGMAREADAPIERVMRSPVLTVSPQDTLEHAAEVLLEPEVSGLPVVEDGRLTGMITESDVFRASPRLLGLIEAGARVVLSVAEGSDLVEEIRRRTAGLAIRSLTASSREGGWEVVMRLRGPRPRGHLTQSCPARLRHCRKRAGQLCVRSRPGRGAGSR